MLNESFGEQTPRRPDSTFSKAQRERRGEDQDHCSNGQEKHCTRKLDSGSNVVLLLARGSVRLIWNRRDLHQLWPRGILRALRVVGIWICSVAAGHGRCVRCSGRNARAPGVVESLIRSYSSCREI